MNILVTGGNGYVGTHFKSLLAGQSSSSTHFTLERRGSKFMLQRIDYRAKDAEFEVLEAIGDLTSALKKHKIEVIVNLAASVRKGDDLEDSEYLVSSNIEFPTKLAIVGVAAGIYRFIQASTFSTSIDGVAYSPQTLYAASKKAAEDMLVYFAQAKNIQVTVLDLFDIYGPKQPHSRLIPSLLSGICNDREVHMSKGEQEISPLFVEDACSALLHAAVVAPESNFQHWSVRGPEVFHVRELPKIISSVLKESFGLVHEPKISHSLPYRKREIMEVRPRFPNLPGWEASVTFTEGIKQAMAGEFD